MDLSHFLGQLMSAVFMIVGLALLIRPSYYTQAYQEWLKNGGLMLFSAMVVLATGVAIVMVHNIWVASGEVLITIVGWAMILKAFLLLFLPEPFEKIVEGLMKHKWLLSFGGLVWVIGGTYMAYYTWFV